jgi:hypothetical protein
LILTADLASQQLFGSIEPVLLLLRQKRDPPTRRAVDNFAGKAA